MQCLGVGGKLRERSLEKDLFVGVCLRVGVGVIPGLKKELISG